jgi:hypothetical protein
VEITGNMIATSTNNTNINISFTNEKWRASAKKYLVQKSCETTDDQNTLASGASEAF